MSERDYAEEASYWRESAEEEPIIQKGKTMSESVEAMRAKLDYCRDMLARAEKAKEVAEQLSENARDLGGGIRGFGGSGNQRAATIVRGAISRAHRAHNEADERIQLWTYKIRSLERRIGEAERVRFTAADLKGATYVKYDTWRRVVRVSAKSVTVESGYSWTDRIPIGQITDFHVSPKTETEASS